MQLSVAFVALLSFIASSLAAPTPATTNHSLVARGRIREQLHEIKEDTKELACKVKEAFKCYRHEVDEHLEIIKADLDEKFDVWKHDMELDFEILKIELIADIAVFVLKFEQFKAEIEADIVADVDAVISFGKLALWDIRFHIAFLWESLIHLEEDIRVEIYELLERLSFDIHVDIGIKYQKYPASCAGVLTQIETVQKYYGEDIHIQAYLPRLLAIHKKVYAASQKTTITQFRGSRFAELD